MAKPIGSPKTGGRSKGTPNKKSQFLSDVFERHGIDLGDELVRIYKQSVFSEEKLQIIYKVLDYCYPKRKAIENDSDEDNSNAPQVILTMPSNGREAP
jgi:hypothetical protein